ncbi:hypothetical protein UB46_26995 [Burkholderiaceae bacterium 16]|nr:hypothetical protein UB46_26995 [Burkholderiaceae bacterium 16]
MERAPVRGDRNREVLDGGVLATINVQDSAGHKECRIQIQDIVHEFAHLTHTSQRMQCPQRRMIFRLKL